MSKLFEILQKIRNKPGMYIGSTSVSDLFHFLVGFKTALRELGIAATKEEMDFYREFQPWLQKKYHVSTSNSWAKIIMLHCANEQEGFNTFYKLLEEFQNSNKNLEEELFNEKSQIFVNKEKISQNNKYECIYSVASTPEEKQAFQEQFKSQNSDLTFDSCQMPNDK